MKRKVSFFVVLILAIAGWFGINQRLLNDLPEITYDKLGTQAIGSTITDRNGVPLYQFFLEDRVYVEYDEIPEQIIDALVSIEDHRFWEHNGIDWQGIGRAMVHNFKSITGEGGGLQGGSSISQQLIKNMFLSPEQSIKRKLQEMILTIKMYTITRDGISSEFSKNHPNPPNEEELKRMSQERILERYINYVFFGNNAYGIQTASKNYFNKPLEELSQKQVAILAGIVKAPTTYNPLLYPKNMLGYRSINDGETTYILEKGHELTESFMAQIKEDLTGKKTIIDAMYTGDTLIQPVALQRYEDKNTEFETQSIYEYDQEALFDTTYSTSKSLFESSRTNDEETTDEQKQDITDIEITKKMLESLRIGTFVNADTTYTYQYHPGRKDTVLRNRHQYGSLSLGDLFTNFADIEPPHVQTSVPSYTIQAPQFVFWVRNILLYDERLSYLGINSHELLTKGYSIQTTLDINLQNAAESASHQTYNNLLGNEGSNRAMLHIDSTNGEVLTYLASHNYFDLGIDGAVDMIQAQRQQGSLRKPFLYAKLLETYKMGVNDTIVDKKLELGKTSPSNADDVYEGEISLTKALTNSKNLPAIRIFFALGGESLIKPYLQQLGLTYILSDVGYGRPLALGSAEESMLHAAQAYLQLSHADNTIPTIFPIQRIVDPDGNIVADYTHCHRSVAIYTNEDEQAVCASLSTESQIPLGVRYLIRTMLKDRSQLYSFWKPLLELGLPNSFAIKTGTSDMKIKGTIYPRDAFTSVYTPDEVLIHRSGNNSGKPLRYNSFSGEINKSFLQKYISNTKQYYDWSHKGYKKPDNQIKNEEFAFPIRSSLDWYAEKYLQGKE